MTVKLNGKSTVTSSSSSDGYKFLLTILGAVAELEREQIIERVLQGVEKCKLTNTTKTGTWFGRPQKTKQNLPKNFEKYYIQLNNKVLTKIEVANVLFVNSGIILFLINGGKLEIAPLYEAIIISNDIIPVTI